MTEQFLELDAHAHLEEAERLLGLIKNKGSEGSEWAHNVAVLAQTHIDLAAAIRRERETLARIIDEEGRLGPS